MTNYQTTSVDKYIDALETFLLGDLATFHGLIASIEASEAPTQHHYTASNSAISVPLSPQTTMAPGQSPESYAALFLNERKFRLTIPVATTLFSAADLFGFLIKAGTLLHKSDHRFNNFFGHPSVNLPPNEIAVLNHVFRQGLVHLFFPKLEYGISYHSSNSARGLFFRDSTNNNNVTLNVNRLEDLVTRGIRAIKNDTGLYVIMEAQFQVMLTDFQRDAAKVPTLNIT